MEYFDVLECRVKGCEADFYLNDVPVFRRSEEAGAFAAGQFHELLVAGRNELAIVVQPGKSPSAALSGGRAERRVTGLEATAEAKVVRYPHGAMIGGDEGVVLGAIRWESAEHRNPIVFPLVRSSAFERESSEAPWSWEQGAGLTVDEATTAKALGFVKELRFSLGLGKPDVFVSAASPRIADLARAYGHSPEEKREESVQWVIGESPGWFFEPLKPAELDLRLCGRNRMVELVRKDGDPFLRCMPSADGGQTSFPLYLGNLKGEWLVVL